jgi:hypothetical protein
LNHHLPSCSRTNSIEKGFHLPTGRRRTLYTPSSQVVKSAACGRRCGDHGVCPSSWSIHLAFGDQTTVRFCSPLLLIWVSSYRVCHSPADASRYGAV